MDPRTAIVWFRRDLRLHDHPALLAAMERADRVVPLFVVDPTLLGGRFASANRTWFMLESVRGLRDSLRARGSDLIVRTGDPRDVVPGFAREIRAAQVYVSRDHAPYGRRRDRAVADVLATTGVAWHARRGVLIHEPDEIATRDGRPFSVYTPFRRAWEAVPRRALLPAPDRLGSGQGLHGLHPGSIPTLTDLGFHRPTAAIGLLPTPGEAAARVRLERWLEGGVDGYDASRDRLDLAAGTSRLSADLRFGLLSPLEVVERASGAGDGRRTFVNEIVWHEFYAHVLFHHPAVRREAFRTTFDQVAWAGDADGLRAWQSGRTGFPIVDAGMRQLAGSGWMHNRARMIAASFLTKDLLVDWRDGEAHFMRHLVDGDVASNNGGWQWSASTGTDAQPWFRVFNPVTQGRRHDPDGAYVRRWVPELAGVPTARIHAPWEMTDAEQIAAGCRIGIDYPAPIVDHAAARVRALAAYDVARRTS
jgi:deoxyribodipyrimidine photo-lyase